MNRAELNKILEDRAVDASEKLIRENERLRGEVKNFRLYSIIAGLVAVAIYVLFLIR